MAGAPREHLEQIIGPLGFFRAKTESLLKLSRGAGRAVRRPGAAAPRRPGDPARASGRKTANVVLGNAFGIPGITVDTHFGRLARRFGWTERDRPGQGRARGRRAVPQARLDDAQPPPDLARAPGLPRQEAGLRRLPGRALVPVVRRGPDRPGRGGRAGQDRGPAREAAARARCGRPAAAAGRAARRAPTRRTQGRRPGRRRSTSTPRAAGAEAGGRDRAVPPGAAASRSTAACPRSPCPAWAAGRTSTCPPCAVRWWSTCGRRGARRAATEMPILQEFAEKYAGRVPVLGIDYQDVQPGAALELAARQRGDLPAAGRPAGASSTARARSRRCAGCRSSRFVDADGVVVAPGVRRCSTSRRRSSRTSSSEHLGVGARDPARVAASRSATARRRRSRPTTSPASCRPRTPTPATRRGADALRRGPRRARPAAHRAGPPHALPPRAGVLPGRLDRPGRDRRSQAALREAEEETGLDPAGVEVFAELPELWLPPSNFAVTPGARLVARAERRSSVVDPDEVHADLPGRRSPSCSTPPTGSPCATRAAGSGPGFLIGDDKDVILWGFTAGIIARLFDYRRLDRAWDTAQVRDLPDAHAAGWPAPSPTCRHPDDQPPRRAAVNLLDWLPGRCWSLAYALSGYWQGFVTGAFATIGLLLGGLFGVWLAPMALGDAEPVAVGLAGRAVHRDPVARRSGQALLPVRRRPDPRQDHLAAGPRRRRRRRRRAQRGRRAAGGLGARRGGHRVPDRRRSPRWCATRRCSRRSTRRCPTRPTGCSRPSTTSSAPASSRATSSRSPPSGSSRSAPGRQRLLQRPRRAAARRRSVVKIRGANSLRPGGRGLRLRLRPRPADDQRPRRRRASPTPRSSVGDDGSRRRGRALRPRARRRRARRSTTPASTPLALRPPRRRRQRGGDPGLPGGRPVRRAVGPDPRRAAAALAQHLRHRHRDPRGLLDLRGTVRPGNSGGPIVTSAGDVVGVVFAASVTDRQTGYALTAEQVRASAAEGVDRLRGGRHRRLRRLSAGARRRSALRTRLSAAAVSCAWSMRPLRAARPS